MEDETINDDGTPVNRPKAADASAAILENLLQNIMALLSIIFGAIYFDDCQIDPRIPVILIVLGALSLSYNLLALIRVAVWGLKVPGDKNKKFDLLTLPIALAAIGAWVATIIFVFSVYSSVNLDEETSADHCNKHLYRFALWSLILPLILWLIKFSYFLCCKRYSA